MKDYFPSISSRTTKELYSILENYNNWEKEAVIQAKEELENRGDSLEMQVEKTKKLIQAKNELLEKLANETFSKSTIVLYILMLPFIIAFGFPFLEDRDLRKTKKNQQRTYMLIAGIAFWFFLLFIVSRLA